MFVARWSGGILELRRGSQPSHSSSEGVGSETKGAAAPRTQSSCNPRLLLEPRHLLCFVARAGRFPGPGVKFSQDRTLRAIRTLSRVPRVRGRGPPAASRAAVSSSRAAAQDVGNGQPLRVSSPPFGSHQGFFLRPFAGLFLRPSRRFLETTVSTFTNPGER